MSGRLRLVGWLLAAALLSACAALLSSTAPMPAGDHIIFPHARHAAAKVECLTCHETLYDATTLGTVGVRPPESTCLQCHKAEKDKGNCKMCHSDVKQARPWPKLKADLNLDHSKHIDRVKEHCEVCHKTLPEPLRPATPPTMSACLSCHQHKVQYDQGRCEVCHQDLAKYPLKPVAAFSHQLDFVHQHGMAARSSAPSCAKCHDQTFCGGCHAPTASLPLELKLPERVERGFIHREDYVGRHSLDAKAQPASCARCHGTSFCTSCHQAQGLTPTSLNPRNPHPVGWGLPGSAQFHGPAARDDISSCAACHDQGPRSICITCHKVGGIGGNPHPTSFLGRHDHQEIQKNGMCLYCHL